MAKISKGKAPAKEKLAPPVSAYDALPLEHKRFVDEYLIDHNATRAYMRVPGNSQNEKSASVLAARLLGKVCIQAALSERAMAAMRRCEMSADRIILEAARIATFDIRKLYHPDGSLKAPHELDDDTAAAIISIEVAEITDGSGEDRRVVGQTKKIRATDKKGAVELAMKHLGLLKDKVEIDPSDRMVSLLRDLQGSALRPVANPAPDDEG